ncbi:hypothetical protein [Pseudolysinimonas sp.]|jgi:hypothetical protein|uniref:hypothetical protein n=1 Tax=Pseudolysinimonas sp. TaxID=2680009 RepID=UPI0037841673
MMTPATRETVHGLGVVGVVLALVFWPAGIAISIVAISRSRRAGRVSRAAVLGLVLGLLAFIATVVLVVFLASGIASLADRCAALGPGEYLFDDGSSLSCG